jgi:hypothetical protein
MTTTGVTPPTVHELTEVEAHELFETEVKRAFGITGAEFIERWKAGKFEDFSDPKITWIASLLPLTRP